MLLDEGPFSNAVNRWPTFLFISGFFIIEHPDKVMRVAADF